MKSHPLLLCLLLFLSLILHPSFFILANDAAVVTAPVSGLQDVFQDLNFPASHPLQSQGVTIQFGNTANKSPILDSSGKFLLSIIPNGIGGGGSSPPFTDSLTVTGSPNMVFPDARRVAFVSPNLLT